MFVVTPTKAVSLTAAYTTAHASVPFSLKENGVCFRRGGCFPRRGAADAACDGDVSHWQGTFGCPSSQHQESQGSS